MDGKGVKVCSEGLWFRRRKLVRYIHRNPLRAGVFNEFDRVKKYPYSGHNTLMSGFSGTRRLNLSLTGISQPVMLGEKTAEDNGFTFLKSKL